MTRCLPPGVLRPVSPSLSRLAAAFCALLAVPGCPTEPPGDLADDPLRYMQSASYRRAILERDLLAPDNGYGRDRMNNYGHGDRGWDLLPAVDRPSRPMLQADLDAMVAGAGLPDGAPLTTLVPDALPTTDAEWIELGRRVFFEYPLRPDPTYEALSRIADGPDDVGFLRDPTGALVGLRVFEGDAGALRVGNTCAQCHASYGGRTEPALDGVLANRAMDLGAARLLVMGLTPGDLPPESESTAVGDLDRLGPGRGDVMADGEFNPFAFPDFGGLGQMPLLHHDANWTQRGIATLAVRCETLFITSSNLVARIPRELSWAIAMWQRSLPAPEPLDAEGSAEAERGEEVFGEASCASCHVPPLYTLDTGIDVESIGTDPSAGLSSVRGTGRYRVPSLRGVGRTAPYLHHGVVPTLEAMFDPAREEPGHEHGLDLSDADRAALLAFLRSI